jgi:hypothetical protein
LYNLRVDGFLAACGKSAHMRIGDAQILVGIYRDVVDADFIVEVRAGAAAAIADVADGVSAVHVLPREADPGGSA